MKVAKLFSAIAVTVMILGVASCDVNNLLPDNPQENEVGPFYTVAEFVVPAGTKTVFVEYANAAGDTIVKEVAVSPKVASPAAGHDVEPFGTVKMQFVSDTKASVNVYFTALPATRSQDEDENVYVLQGAHLTQASGGTVTEASDAAVVHIEEPAPYTTEDAGQTFYHSSGVVMFDDAWPGAPSPTGSFINDYNDVVVDYDFEARVVDDALLATEGWREQLKVVLHLRALGGDRPARVGLILENFDQQYVDYIELFKSLDSYLNPHGELPPSFESRIGQNCIHNESNPLRPWFEMGGIHRLNENNAERNISSEEYTYTNYDENGNLVSHKCVFNPSFGYWSGPDESQYEAGIERKMPHYYNATPGYVNVHGGLITITLIYHLKPRAEMTAEQSAAARQNLIDAAMVTTNQNFYIMLQNYSEIGLKGYAPRDSYKAKYDQIVAESSYLSGSNYYTGNDGQVYGIKAPVLTRHLWEKYPFASAYPKYPAWLAGDATASDWYLDYDNKFLACWW